LKFTGTARIKGKRKEEEDRHRYQLEQQLAAAKLAGAEEKDDGAKVLVGVPGLADAQLAREKRLLAEKHKALRAAAIRLTRTTKPPQLGCAQHSRTSHSLCE